MLAAAALEMLLGGLFLLSAGTLRREWSALAFTPRTAGAFFYLVLVGAIGGFCAYLYALKHLPVSLVSLYAYVNPGDRRDSRRVAVEGAVQVADGGRRRHRARRRRLGAGRLVR